MRDNGVGIPPTADEHLRHVHPGRRVAGAAQGGLGIGLTLVRRLVQMHGGSVEAEAPEKGKGSEFVVRLPDAQRRQRVAAARRREPGADRTPRRILVVDDNRDAAESLAMLLQITGHETFTALRRRAAL